MRARFLPIATCSSALTLIVGVSAAWASISSLPLVLIDTRELTDSTSQTVAFSSIASKVPLGTEHLMLEVIASSTDTVAGMADVRINNDSGNNYARNYLTTTNTVFSKLASTANAGWVADIPPSSSGGHSSSTVLFPWAFGNDYKTMLGITSSHGERLTQSKAHWLDTAPISSISLSTPNAGTYFEAGSIFRLWAVDERFRVAGQILESNGALGLGVPQAGEHLVMMLHGRSDEQATNGARAHQALNGDVDDTNYFSQRLAAEVPRIQDQLFNNSRIAYIPSDSQPAGHFGDSVALYPWFGDAARDRTYIFQHANDDESYKATQIESGRWVSNDALTSIDYSIQLGGTQFVAGSQLALSRTKPPLQRVVLEQDQSSVTLQVPDLIVGSSQVLFSARSDRVAEYDGVAMSINGDANDANYLVQTMGATNGTHSSSRENSRVFGVMPGSATAAGVFAGGSLTLFESSRDDRQKEFLYFGGAAEERVQLSGGAWLANEPITSITFHPANGGNFKAGSTFEIWTQQVLGMSGDFNDDGIVDTADYVVWRHNLGDSTEDDIHNNGDGLDGVDAADYDVWKQHFGEPIENGPGTGRFARLEPAVPEPSELTLVTVAVLVMFLFGYQLPHRRAGRRCGS